MAFNPYETGILERAQIVDEAGHELVINPDGSLPVSPAVSPSPGNTTVTNVAASLTEITVAASNAARRSLAIFNESTARLYLKLGSGVAANSFTVVLGPYDLYELESPIYTGIVTGLWTAAVGSAGVTETV